MNTAHLDKLFNPRSIAMIGASEVPEKWGFMILINILNAKFAGPVYPVNPQRKSIVGVPCYASVKDIPGPVELAIITTPAHTVSGLIDECGAKGISNLIVISSDFSETGPEGMVMEQEIAAKARGYGMRMVGPNTMGIYSASSNLCALMVTITPKRGPVSMLSQSGNMISQMLHWGANEGVGFDKLVSSGNEADLTCEDYLGYFGQDKTTQVILAYLEGVDPGSLCFPWLKQLPGKNR
jgi:acetyltransferase